MKTKVTTGQIEGFTLIEVISGLAILVLIIGGVFSIATGSMDLSTRSNLTRMEEIRLTQFREVLKTTFNQLPPLRKIEVQPDASLIIKGTQSSFRWPGVPASADTVVILLRDDNIEVVHLLGDAEVASLALMEGVSDMMWELHDENPVSLLSIRFSKGEDKTFEEVFQVPVYKHREFIVPPTDVSS